MSKTYEARTVDLFGPQLLIESGGAVGVAGQCVWKLSSINESGIRYVQGLFQSGLSKIYAEGPLQVEGGKKAQSSEGVSIINIAHNGDYSVVASEGWARIKAQNIVLEADDQLHLLGNDIQIGYKHLDRTQKITLSATEDGIARFTPSEPPELDLMIVLIPINLPFMSINAPPEFPLLIEASVCK